LAEKLAGHELLDRPSEKKKRKDNEEEEKKRMTERMNV
jgi:hypothetical protein